MSNELTNKLEIAIAEKYARLIPQNIKNGVKIFGVTGAYTPDLSEYFNGTIGEGTDTASSVAKMIKTIPANTTVPGDSLIRAFQYSGIETIPLIDTKYVEIMSYMCRGCGSLKDIPVLNTERVYVMANAFQNCGNLTDESLNNIMQMCINSSITSNKTLSNIGLSSTQRTKCTTLSNYQAFLNAGWSAS